MSKTFDIDEAFAAIPAFINERTARMAKVVALRNFFDLEANGPVTDEIVLEMWNNFVLYCRDSSDGEMQYMDALFLSKDALKDEVLPRVVYTPFEYDTMADLYNGVFALHNSILLAAYRAGLIDRAFLDKELGG